MKKVCVNAVTVEGFDSIAQATKLVNEQMECDVNVQTIIRVLKMQVLRLK